MAFRKLTEHEHRLYDKWAQEKLPHLVILNPNNPVSDQQVLGFHPQLKIKLATLLLNQAITQIADDGLTKS